ncbi:hypothetical protein N8E89_24335 (plasmid) [Phyllobacterium sp. A18/5-2]|uniref:hypothetical protein n=1 Tax=Phyllobacterium sp. A18/5-2 TaxID=2978392 RepID=UPI0021C7D720|nr:hypothetical protein [Phyllobacterium sp. A18/5-2]UXN66299.1 hypothetical protein N8E89_24335 [Phyllobacterium sp. A18/5-2]
MPQKLNYKLMGHDCGVIYLRIPEGVTDSTIIHCSQCGKPMGTWLELEASFITQGGTSGVFDMHDGQIIRRD